MFIVDTICGIKIRKERMSTSFENYNENTELKAEKNILPPLLLVSTPTEIFKEIEPKDLNSFVSGADILLIILEKSGAFSDEDTKKEIQHSAHAAQLEFDTIFTKKTLGYSQKTDIDKIMRLYDLTDDAVDVDTLLNYGELFRKSANTSAKKEQALSFERLIRFMYLKQTGGLEKLDEDTLQTENKDLL